MTTKVLLIRHGQTDWNRQRRVQGHLDIPLNETGHAQAQALAQRLAHWPITTIYSSDLQRAVATAQPLAHTLNLPLNLSPNWRERFLGQFQGLTIDELHQQYGDATPNTTRYLIDPPDGESGQQLQQRIIHAWHDTITPHTDEMIAIITHGGALTALIAYILNLDMATEIRFRMRGNTGLSIIHIDNGQPLLLRLNDTAHLDP
ncbi:MAG TPA: histidine phosphatase family protein [Anaerolineae bacterium]|nr:histidine phosphatase family protein [Anaerolineae bacterium]